MFEETYRTNKSIPEWSSMIIFSLIILLNIISITILLNISLLSNGKIVVLTLLTIILILNYFYFLKNNRYKEILKYYRNKEFPTFYHYLVILYELISFFICVKLIGLNIYESLILIGIIITVKVFAFLFYKMKS